MRLCRYGSHRVIEPPGALPQGAWRVDNTPRAQANEILIDVEALNIDSASFRQMREACGGDAAAVGAQVLETVRTRGKQHNPVTGSGGMLVGRVAEIGERLCARGGLTVGDRIATLVSLSLTPLYIEQVLAVELEVERVRVRGKAVLFESGLYTRLPDDLSLEVALAVLDVAGAPAQTKRICRDGDRVLVIGAGGKSGMLCVAQAREAVGARGRVFGLERMAGDSTALLLREGYLDALIEADARDALAVLRAYTAIAGEEADVVINCVNVPGTELATILPCRERGTAYFFNMATSFTAAALGAEGVGKDVDLLIGNGYAAGHARIALDTVMERPALLAFFQRRFAAPQPV
ncbi:L-erythro-3,5-diaminohexanoate dehydrogenase [bacterium]|nr:MAG: L-erythro-3,5-diaminohexanoate dehydrogenase [bacterium]